MPGGDYSPGKRKRELKRQRDRQSNKTKVNIGVAFPRWKELIRSKDFKKGHQSCLLSFQKVILPICVNSKFYSCLVHYRMVVHNARTTSRILFLTSMMKKDCLPCNINIIICVVISLADNSSHVLPVCVTCAMPMRLLD